MLWRSSHSQVGGWVDPEQSQYCGCSTSLPILSLLPSSSSPLPSTFSPSLLLSSLQLQNGYSNYTHSHIPLMFPFLNVGGSLPLCRNSLSAGNAQRRDGGSAMSTKTLRLGGEGGGGEGWLIPKLHPHSLLDMRNWSKSSGYWYTSMQLTLLFSSSSPLLLILLLPPSPHPSHSSSSSLLPSFILPFPPSYAFLTLRRW